MKAGLHVQTKSLSLLKKISILTDPEFEPPEGLPRGNGGPGESAGHRTGGCHVSKAKGRPGNVVCENERG